MVTGTWRGEPCEAVQALAIDKFEEIIEEFGPTEYDIDPFSIKIREPWTITVYDMWWLLRSGDDAIAVSNEDWINEFVLTDIEVPTQTFKKDEA